MRRSFAAFSSIVGLLLRSGPSAIAWFIIAVVVIPLNGMTGRWLRPHVFEEVFETSQPPFAYRYASPTVVGPLVRIFVETPRLHSGP